MEWHLIGAVDEMKKRRCRKIYLQDNQALAFFYIAPDRFYLTNASCPHARGPLDQGDIEDIDGSLKVMCPLHFYSFDLQTGESSSGLKLLIYRTEVKDGNVFGFTPLPIKLTR